MPLAAALPKPGEALAIAGYGPGIYREAAGQCTQYLAPGRNAPCEMVELSAAARQGDSGGPIVNTEGKLAGVLFGSGHGTTTGACSRRVWHFLAPLAPDLGGKPLQPDVRPEQTDPIVVAAFSGPVPSASAGNAPRDIALASERTRNDEFVNRKAARASAGPTDAPVCRPASAAPFAMADGKPPNEDSVLERVKTLLALLGGLSIASSGIKRFCR
jgi:hypothetical protein